MTINAMPPTFVVPSDACDCHVHVFGSPLRFPLSPGRVYTPGEASVASLLEMQRALGLQRVVLIQPSPYGTDNSCLLHALRVLGPRARGVAVADGSTDAGVLDELHSAGVRGVRVNLETGRHVDVETARQALLAAAALAAPRGWHVQAYLSLTLLAALKPNIIQMPCALVIDHFGRAQAALGVAQHGFASLLSLLQSADVYVKLSAPHRISAQPGYEDAGLIARALLHANPTKTLWGSDWPHAAAKPDSTRLDVIEPFLPEDDGAALNRLKHWTRNEAELRAILVENPARLYEF